MVVSIRIPTQVIKRTGETVPFDENKIKTAVYKCISSFPENTKDAHDLWESINDIIDRVMNVISIRYQNENEPPTVEQVQDVVVFVLQSGGYYREAEHYIIYRHEHAKQREATYIPPEVVSAFENDVQYFPTPIQAFQFYDKYSRWNNDLGRRETWKETVHRATNYLGELANNQIQKLEVCNVIKNEKVNIVETALDEVNEAIKQMRVMPSMRLLAMAGEPARRDNSTIYNCSYLPIDSLESYCELMANSMAGCGVGYSVEWQYVKQLPEIKYQRNIEAVPYIIEDSTEGWINAVYIGLERWFDGLDITFDFSLIRPKGSVLKTKGGRASGHEPLKELLERIKDRILARQGKQLTPLDAHDIACAIGNAVVSGGVRRTALISLFDADDKDMLSCKTGDFEKDNNQRWNANNSAVWPVNITQFEALQLLNEMFVSERGEPGIFSRDVANATIPDRRKLCADFGTNPCGEINLRRKQFCNLSIVVARAEDTFETLKEKVRLATIIGTIQSCATYFPNLSDEWRKNCEEERLLGVDITGQADAKIDSVLLAKLKNVAIETNKEWAELLGINQSAAITCNKPSGNSSVLLNASSGIHARHADYYVRNVRVTDGSPVHKVLVDAGMPMQPENGQDITNVNTWVVSFPVKSPDGAITRHHVTAIDQCENWLMNKKYWTEHNPSVTITYEDNEVIDLINWIWEHREWINGMSFAKKSNIKLDQLPYVEITEEEYYERVSLIPDKIPWQNIYLYEKEDRTTAAQEIACMANGQEFCELP